MMSSSQARISGSCPGRERIARDFCPRDSRQWSETLSVLVLPMPARLGFTATRLEDVASAFYAVRLDQ